MALLRVREKYQMTLPSQVVRDHRISVGDLLDAEIVGGVLRLNPKNPVDRKILQGRRDYANGDYDGPFSSVAEMHAADGGGPSQSKKRRRR